MGVEDGGFKRVDLSGKVAIVTGGSKGIGRIIAVGLARRGARVVICYRSDAEAATGTEKLGQQTSGEIRSVQGDVSNPEQVARLVEQCLAWHGRIDLLVNNAGVTANSLLAAMSTERWQTVLDTNLTGVFLCCRQVIRPMMRNRGGKILNISSSVGLRGAVGQANYAATRSALLGLTRSLARELGPYGIMVNMVNPGFVVTDMSRDPSAEQRALQDSVLNRHCDPDDIAEFVAFLASDLCRYVTGQVFHVDSRIV